MKQVVEMHLVGGVFCLNICFLSIIIKLFIDMRACHAHPSDPLCICTVKTYKCETGHRMRA